MTKFIAKVSAVSFFVVYLALVAVNIFDSNSTCNTATKEAACFVE